MIKLQTLCLVCEPSRILLGMKKRGFGVGRWNGFGGKLNPGEGVDEAMRREMKEEADIDIDAMEKVGILTFVFDGGPDPLEVHVYRVQEYRGEPVESEEMRPEWFEIDKIPFDDMWPDDAYWLPLLLAEKKFIGHFDFVDGKIAAHNLKEVTSLDV